MVISHTSAVKFHGRDADVIDVTSSSSTSTYYIERERKPLTRSEIR